MKKPLVVLILASAVLFTSHVGAVTAAYKGLTKKFQDRYNEMKEKAKTAIDENQFNEARMYLKKASLSQEVLTMMKEEKPKTG